MSSEQPSVWRWILKIDCFSSRHLCSGGQCETTKSSAVQFQPLQVSVRSPRDNHHPPIDRVRNAESVRFRSECGRNMPCAVCEEENVASQESKSLQLTSNRITRTLWHGEHCVGVSRQITFLSRICVGCGMQWSRQNCYYIVFRGWPSQTIKWEFIIWSASEP